MLTSVFAILFAAMLSDVSAPTDGLFRLREFVVEADFASAAVAQQAQLKLEELPRGKKLAFATRWDDSNPRHTNTLAAISAAGCKGTFYFVSTTPFLRDAVMKPILAAGSRIGSHTCSHPFLTQCTPAKIFREIAANRPELEAVSGSAVSSFTLPYGAVETPSDPNVAGLIGESLKRTGLYAGCERNPEEQKIFGLTPYEWVAARMFAADDRGPDPKMFAEGLAAAKADVACHPSGGPCVVLGVHSWHPDKGYPVLTSLLKTVSSDPTVWCCTVDEYAAFRLQMRHAKILSREVKGRTASFRLSIPESFDLGSVVPLTFSFGVAPSAVRADGQVLSLEDGIAELVPRSDVVPATFALFRNAKNVAKGNAHSAIGESCGRQLWLSYDSKTETVQVTLVNGPVALKSVDLALRLPLAYEKGVQYRRIDFLQPNETFAFDWPLGGHCSKMNRGDLFFSLQMDGAEPDARRIRLWAETHVARPTEKIACPRDRALVSGPLKSKPDVKNLISCSVVGAKLPAMGTEPWHFWRAPLAADGTASYAVCSHYPDNKMQSGFTSALRAGGQEMWMVVSYDFDSASIDVRTLVFRAQGIRGDEPVLCLNGCLLEPGTRKLPVQAGANRLLLAYPLRAAYSFLAELSIW